MKNSEDKIVITRRKIAIKIPSLAEFSVISSVLTRHVYAIPYGQYGFTVGIGIEGSKITHIQPRL
jgi:hypothetical protein